MKNTIYISMCPAVQTEDIIAVDEPSVITRGM